VLFVSDFNRFINIVNVHVIFVFVFFFKSHFASYLALKILHKPRQDSAYHETTISQKLFATFAV